MTLFPYQGNSILSAQGKSQPMINYNTLRMTLTPPWFNVGNKGTTRSLRTLIQTRRCLPHSHSTTVCRGLPRWMVVWRVGRGGLQTTEGHHSTVTTLTRQLARARTWLWWCLVFWLLSPPLLPGEAAQRRLDIPGGHHGLRRPARLCGVPGLQALLEEWLGEQMA